jgi:small-conductance mechanosensitive channel
MSIRRARRSSLWSVLSLSVIVVASVELAGLRDACAKPAKKAAAAQPSATQASPTEAPPAAASEPSAVKRQLDTLTALEGEVLDLRKRVKQAEPAAQAALQPQLVAVGSRYQRQLNEGAAALRATPALEGSAEERSALEARLKAGLTSEAGELTRHLRDTFESALAGADELLRSKPEQRGELETSRARAFATMDGLLGELHDNLAARTVLGQDVGADTATYTQLLGNAVKLTGDALVSVKGELGTLRKETKGKPKPEEEKRIAGLVEFRGALADAQRKNIARMEEQKLDTIQLRQDLISATGEMTPEILDAEVLTGLATNWKNDAVSWFSANAASMAFRLLAFCAILGIFGVLAGMGRGLVRRALGRTKGTMSGLASEFFISSAGRLVWLIGFVIAAAQLGIEVGPLIAGLGIAGFVLGFALQDTLSNFAAGMMILAYRPFDIGDLIEAGGVAGSVKAMTLVTTSILTVDNQLIIVPNSKIWGGVIVNVTSQPNRRVDLEFAVSYRDDVNQAERILSAVVRDNPRVLAEPAAVVKLHALGESSVKFVVRPWVKTDDYWDAYWEITRDVKLRFDAAGLAVPYPQRELHVYEERLAERAPRESQVAPVLAG